MAQNENLRDHRVENILSAYKTLYKQAQEKLALSGREEYIHTELKALGMLTVDLPIHLKQLVSISSNIIPISVGVNFGHYNDRAPHPPTFSFGVSWERTEGVDNSVINMLHFGIKENPQKVLIDNYFPSDSKTAYQSFGPHIGHFPLDYPLEKVPQELRGAIVKKWEMDKLMANPDFQIGLAEELGSLPYK